MLMCPRCGGSNPPGTRFCTECGLELSGAAAEAKAAPAATAVAQPVGAGGAGPTAPPAERIQAARPPLDPNPAPASDRPDAPAIPAASPPPTDRQPVRPATSRGGAILKMIARIVGAIALLAIGWALGTLSQPPPPAAAPPVATPTFNSQAALRATIEANARVQSLVTVPVGPDGTSLPLPWGGSVAVTRGAINETATLTVERLPDATDQTLIQGPARVFRVDLAREPGGTPIGLLFQPILLSGAGIECLIAQGGQEVEFEPIDSRLAGSNQIECVLPRPGIVAIRRR